MEEDIRSVELGDIGEIPLKGPNGELEVHNSAEDQVFSSSFWFSSLISHPFLSSYYFSPFL